MGRRVEPETLLVPVFEDDTPQSLAARVFVEECEAYPEAIAGWAARSTGVGLTREDEAPPA